MADGMKPPQQFLSSTVTSELAQSWKKWIEQFDFYMLATERDKKSGKIQVATLLTLMGPDAMEVFRSFQFAADGDKDNISKVKEKFEGYYTPRVNETFERYKFLKRKQQAGESFECFLADLTNLIGTCAYNVAERDNILRDQIVMGVYSNTVREKLLDQEKLTLAKAAELCRANEVTSHLIAEMTGGNAESVHAVHSHRPTKQKFKGSTTKSSTTTRKLSSTEGGMITDCKYCGGKHKYGACPAFGAECRRCSKKGHFERCCYSQSKQKQKSNCKVDKSVSEVQFVVNGVTKAEVDYDSWYIALNNVDFKVDTGAQVNLINEADIARLDQNVSLKKSNSSLSSYTGHEIPVLGVVDVSCTYRNVSEMVEFQVVGEEYVSILGLPTLLQLGIVHINPTVCVDGIYGGLKQQSDSSQMIDEFDDLFKDGIGKFKVKPYHIKLRDDAIPHVAACRQVPQALQGKLKSELDRLEAEEIIRKVEEPTDWVNPMVIVEKPDGRIRLCLDTRELNKYVLRERYSLPSTTEIFGRLADAKVFSTIDLTSGFFHVMIDEESQDLTTFMTPMGGRYKFTRLVQGLCSSPEVFHRILSQSLEELTGVEVYIDDIICYGVDQKDHDEKLRKLLEKCRELGLRLNKSKCYFGKESVKFLGHEISSSGLTAQSDKIRAVTEMEPPSCKQDVRRFLGFVTYLAKFCPKLSEVTGPMRLLLKNETVFHWGRSQQIAFELCKKLATEAPTLRIFDPKLPVKLSVDASGSTLAAVLLQEGRPIEYAAKSLTETQHRYSIIEKELLAVLFGCRRFHYYLYGRKFEVESDHKPLVGLVNKPIQSVSKRFQNMLLELQSYDFELKYTPGHLLFLADTLTRVVTQGSDKTTSLEDVHVKKVAEVVFASNEVQQKYRDKTLDDPELQSLSEYVRSGWPTHKRECNDVGRRFWHIHDSIRIEGDLLFYGDRWITPLSCRREMLAQVHKGHLGLTKTVLKAKTSVYWPGMARDIENMVQSCTPCQEYNGKVIKEPLRPSEIPQYPFEIIGVDLFELEGKKYMLSVDYFSKWCTVYELRGETSGEVASKLAQLFTDFGIPRVLRSDNGPCFSSGSFRSFLTQYGIEHRTSSPRFPQSNGMAERHIQTIKNLMKKCIRENKPWLNELLALRNTPIDAQLPYSPAQLLQGRSLHEGLPINTEKLIPKSYDRSLVRSGLEIRQANQKLYHDRSATDQRVIKEGELVRVLIDRDWVLGEVQRMVTPRSYVIRTESGTYRRNRSQVRPTGEMKSVQRQSLQVRDFNKPSNPPNTVDKELVTKPQPGRVQSESADVPSSATSSESAGGEAQSSGIRRSQRQTRAPARFDEYVKY